jgi:CubicO group peptidase (beta-lactamase class C family)
MIRTAFHAATLFAAPFALIAAPAAAQSLTPAQTAQVDTLVARALQATATPSASIAIVRGGRIVYAKAYGKQSDAIATARVDVKYPIASNSKQVTAAAILLLARDGKLSLDDSVARWVPGVTDGDRITIRQLLSHTSGLRDYWPQDYSFAAMEKPTTPQGIIDRWAKAPLDFAPGSQWQYSNTGYVVAGQIVEKASGMPLMRFLDTRIFRPLGMTPVDQDDAVGAGYPTPYHRYALGPVRVARPAAAGWLYAAGELAMSASDVAKWDIARLNRTILTPADWAMQETPVKLTDGSATNYGLGVSLGTTPTGRRFVTHGGEAVGFLSENTVFPDDKAAIVVLTNSDFGDATSTISDGIAKIILPDAPTGDAAKTVEARSFYDALTAGRLDRAKLTANAAYYFDPTTTADYTSSLAPLGVPKAFAQVGKTRLRGGFVNRNYQVTYPGRSLIVVTYAEPDGAQRYEQFIVMPAN